VSDPTDWLQRALARAATVGVGPAELDYLIAEVTGLDRLQLRVGGEALLTPWLERLDALWERRLHERLPLQYLLGRAHWRDLCLAVSPAVLIPRPETELLVDIAIEACRDRPAPLIADLGTGSGAIAVAVARSLPAARVFAVDASREALAIARANVEAYGLTDRIELLEGSWFAALEADLRFDAVLSNPPYIPSAEVAGLADEVRLHEPHLALDGGSDGLVHVRTLVAQAHSRLIPGGLLTMELMAGQARPVAALIERDVRYGEVTIRRDLAGIERFVLAHARVPDNGKGGASTDGDAPPGSTSWF